MPQTQTFKSGDDVTALMNGSAEPSAPPPPSRRDALRATLSPDEQRVYAPDEPVLRSRETSIRAVNASDPVTLADLQDDPVQAMQRIGQQLKRDLSDPKLWATAVAMYFAPSIVSRAMPVAMRAAGAVKSGAGKVAAGGIRGAAAVGDVVSPDVIGIVSPRMGRAVETAQRLRGAMPTASEPVAAPRGVPESPAAPVESTAPPQSLAESTPRPPPGKSPQQVLNEEAIARRRAEYAATQAPAPSAATAPLQQAGLRLDQVQEYRRLIQMGKSTREALEILQQQVAFAEQFGLKTPTDAETKFPKGQRGGARRP